MGSDQYLGRDLVGAASLPESMDWPGWLEEEVMEETNYYVIRGGRFVNVRGLVPADVAEAVLDELSELAEPVPGDEEYARVFSKALSRDEVSRVQEPQLADCLGFHLEDTGLDPIDVLQWNSAEVTGYYLLKKDGMVGIEDALGAVESDVMRDIFLELDGIFEPIEDSGTGAYVRVKSLQGSDLYEDEGDSEVLRDLLREYLNGGGQKSMEVFQWTG